MISSAHIKQEYQHMDSNQMTNERNTLFYGILDHLLTAISEIGTKGEVYISPRMNLIITYTKRMQILQEVSRERGIDLGSLVTN